jgi:UDP-2,4-diacetamido-2,4,6-trideoxy-beta-L-altropyranose hydrolase
VDGHAGIGGGHIVRSLALAEELRRREWGVALVTAEVPSGLRDVIRESGFAHHMLSRPVDAPPTAPGGAVPGEIHDASEILQFLGASTPDWIVVDHYGLSAAWEATVRPATRRILAVDDLARIHDCDLLLDQNYYERPGARYADSSLTVRALVGPRYALLRSQFYREPRKTRTGPIRRVLVSFGASDPTGETEKALECLLRQPEGRFRTDVLFAASRLPGDMLRRARARDDIRLLGWVEDVASLMRSADLCIGAGGTTTWERCATGLPALVVVVADNQKEVMTELARYGAVRLLGESPGVTPATIESALADCLANPDAVASMSERALALVPEGRPGVALVADEMEALL